MFRGSLHSRIPSPDFPHGAGCAAPNLMSRPALQFDGVSKKFCRSLSSTFLYAAQDLSRRWLGSDPVATPRRDEFWALHEVSFAAQAGECLGIIGPNGAGKSTLLKLASGEIRPTLGRVRRTGRPVSLIRLGTGLQPMLSGRENIEARCHAQGLKPRARAAKIEEIAAFAGLGAALERPVRHYSDGMYTRLEFSIATSFRPDILLIDEVLAVGDLGFQLRCLDRMETLKREGCTLLFVSHSEMHVRQIADRCLLLFDGITLAQGETDALYHRYYEAAGFLYRHLRPLGTIPEMPEDFHGAMFIERLRMAGTKIEPCPLHTAGENLELLLDYRANLPASDPKLVVQFWNSADLLLATMIESLADFPTSSGRLRIVLSAPGLAAGVYRLAGGFRSDGEWLGYSHDLLRLAVTDHWVDIPTGPYRIRGQIHFH